MPRKPASLAIRMSEDEAWERFQQASVSGICGRLRKIESDVWEITISRKGMYGRYGKKQKLGSE